MLQGERPMAKDNRTLGKFHLVGIPTAPRGVPQIEVTFDIDANGIVNVLAKDLGTGKEQTITITASSGLSKEDVARMMKEAEAHADEDKQRQEEVETHNTADQAVYSAERMLQESGDKLSDDTRQPIQDAIDAVKKAKEGSDVDATKRALEQLTMAQHKAAEEMYKQTAESGTPPPGESPPGDETATATDTDAASDEASAESADVIDAEVVEDEKK